MEQSATMHILEPALGQTAQALAQIVACHRAELGAAWRGAVAFGPGLYGDHGENLYLVELVGDWAPESDREEFERKLALKRRALAQVSLPPRLVLSVLSPEHLQVAITRRHPLVLEMQAADLVLGYKAVDGNLLTAVLGSNEAASFLQSSEQAKCEEG
jgi:hypothetical protein